MILIFECLPCALYFICSLEFALTASLHSLISVFMLCGGEKKTKPQIVNNEKEEKNFFVDSQFSVRFSERNFM